MRTEIDGASTGAFRLPGQFETSTLSDLRSMGCEGLPCCEGLKSDSHSRQALGSSMRMRPAWALQDRCGANRRCRDSQVPSRAAFMSTRPVRSKALRLCAQGLSIARARQPCTCAGASQHRRLKRRRRRWVCSERLRPHAAPGTHLQRVLPDAVDIERKVRRPALEAFRGLEMAPAGLCAPRATPFARVRGAGAASSRT